MAASKMEKSTKVDIVLLVCCIVAIILACMSCYMMYKHLHHHRRYIYTYGPRYRGHHTAPHGAAPPPPPGFVETECEVEDVEDPQERVACRKNERGEWCQGPAPPTRSRRSKESHEERDPGRRHEEKEEREEHRRGGRREEEEEREEHRRGGRGEEEEEREEHRWEGRREEEERRALASGSFFPRRNMRAFPCMRMRVLFRLQHRTRHAMAHPNPEQASNFPRCSFSSCEEDEATNKEDVELEKTSWMQQKDVPTHCFVNKTNPDHVIILSPKLYFGSLCKSPGFHGTVWMVLIAIILAVVLIVRRCKNKPRIAETPRPDPKKLPGGAYLVTPASEKEREALGMVLPSTEPRAQPDAPSKEFLALQPPSYEIVAKPIPAFTIAAPPYNTPAPEKKLPVVE